MRVSIDAIRIPNGALQWKKVTAATSQGALGDPVGGGTSAAVCLYDDDGNLVQDFVVSRGGQLCGEKPCWKTKGTKGYGYQDKAASADGITKLSYGAGAATKGQASAAGANNTAKGLSSLPTGVAAALTGTSHRRYNSSPATASASAPR